MHTFFALFITLSQAQMTQDQILNLLVVHAHQNKMSKDTVCGSLTIKQDECLKKQFWLDLNSDTMDTKHSHTKPVYATLFKDIENTNYVCSIEMKVDPMKKSVSAKRKDWTCRNTQADGAKPTTNAPQ